MADTPQTAIPQEHHGKARERILAAAEAVFAEKGFDGARVDEIAARARVNKAHLYYHFQDKASLLRAVVGQAVRETAEMMGRSFASMGSFSFEAFQAMSEEAFTFFAMRDNILRLLMREAMKSSAEEPSLFAVFDPIYRQVQSSMQKFGVRPKSGPHDSLIEYFFFDIGPLLLFAVLKDRFGRFYGIETPELAGTFKRLYLNNTRRYAERIAKNIGGGSAGEPISPDDSA
jgi:AcrR family transcriptional regulator